MSPVQVAPPTRPPARAELRPPGAITPAGDSPLLRLAAFAALAAFATGHWFGLVAAPPAARTAAVVAIGVAGAAALAALPRLRAGRGSRFALAALVALATLAVGLAAAGLEARLLLPGGWGQLADGLDRGLSGVRTADWPYQGPDDWVRLTILLGAPLGLAAAAALSFWPARRGAPVLRGAGLLLLLLLYGVAVTEYDQGAPLLRGFVLLTLVAAWLWLPRLSPREAGRGAVLVAVVGVCSLPVAAALDGDRPWWDYRSWHWFGGGQTVAFDWDHSYGPLDWPREGTTLLNVKSDRRHYWKVETLDSFDGFRWLRARGRTSSRATSDLPRALEPQGPTWEYFEWNPRWDERIRFTVRALRSDLVVGAGTTYAVRGAGTTVSTADGTTPALGDSLEKGDSYTVSAYAPDPTAAQMRRAPALYPAGLIEYTAVALPRRGQTAGQAGGRSRPPDLLYLPLRGDLERASSLAGRRLLASPYRRTYELARRLVSGAPTTYDAVKRIERHLQRGYRYTERPPDRRYPLAAFLFEDRAGYCQQFSGAMALMLRMVGIPARVAAGFSPGSYNRDSGEYRVRDVDAHSWVEVHFPGIGWVPFDPTPSAAPAASQSSGADVTSAARAEAGERGPGPGDAAPGPNEPARTGGAPDGDRLSWWAVPALLALALLAAAGWRLALATVRARRSAGSAPADAQLRELMTALARLGWQLPPGTTLLALERRLTRAAGPGAALYAAGLRAHRYGPDVPPPPGPAERRELRRALTAGRGLRAKARGMLALPPRPLYRALRFRP